MFSITEAKRKVDDSFSTQKRTDAYFQNIRFTRIEFNTLKCHLQN